MLPCPPPPIPPRDPLAKSSSSLQSSLRSQASALDLHNVSHDSGVISASSPAMQMLSTSSPIDNRHVPRAARAVITPVTTTSTAVTAKANINNRWNRLGSFFKKNRKHFSDDEAAQHVRQLIVKNASPECDNDRPPPPLPPRQHHQACNVFQPTMMVRPSFVNPSPQMKSPTSLVLHSSPTVPLLSPFNNSSSSSNGFYFQDRQRNWREQKEDIMQRVEAKRNSLIDSSDEENTVDETSSQSSSSMLRRRTSGKRSSWRKSREIDPRKRMLVQAQVQSRMETAEARLASTANPPPPPPPRDPRRRLYLLKNDEGRPVSYPCEQSPPNPFHHSPQTGFSPHPSDLGVPTVDRNLPQGVPHSLSSVQDEQQRPVHRRRHLSASDQHLFSRLNTGVPFSQSNPFIALGKVTPAESCSAIDEAPPRSRRPILRDKPLPLTTYASQPSLMSAPPPVPPPPSLPPQGEYWKSPPPTLQPQSLFYPIPMHVCERAIPALSDLDYSPERPLRKRVSNCSKATSRDSVISPHQSSNSSIEKNSGKSSPSSSVSSKDSGCSEPLQQQLLPPRPLSTLLEKSESQDRVTSPSPPTKEFSPPRSFENDPGFSTRQRRHRFLDAMNELEDVLGDIQRDQDLLDRAERRDLPTAHQELIAQARDQFQGEETSRNDDEEDSVFSDMDNFMNWNTSSSFENIVNPKRRSRSRTPRTPSNRRSGVYDKVTDDMAFRIARANNRTPSVTANPIAKVDHSFLLHSPVKVNLNDETPKLSFEDPEPNAHSDDVIVRQLRDVHSAHASLESQPKFGIPRNPPHGCSNKDYLHAVPDIARYRSTFHSMRNPDLVLDDLAFRNLRRDESLMRDPSSLGVRDLGKERQELRTARSAIEHQERAESQEREEYQKSRDPVVFYPNRHNAVMKSLSAHIAQIIRKQSGNPDAGGDDDEAIVTYEDLKRNPAMYECMRYTLNIIKAEEEERKKREMEEVEWNGKNVFQLLTTNVSELLEKQRKKSLAVSGSSDHHTNSGEGDKCEDIKEVKAEEILGGSRILSDVITQHCILEQDLSAFNQTLRKHLSLKDEDESKTVISEGDKVEFLSDGVENTRQTELGLERRSGKSEIEGTSYESSTRDLGKVEKEEEGETKKKTKKAKKKEKKQREHDDKGEDLECCRGGGGGDHTAAATTALRHPALLMAAYCLASIYQISGLDFFAALGVILAGVSMIAMFYL